MNKVEQQIECSACSWNQHYIEPPTMTREEIDNKLAAFKCEKFMSPEEQIGHMAEGVFNAMMLAGKDLDARVCHVFAKVLRSGPEMSVRIKNIMQGKE